MSENYRYCILTDEKDIIEYEKELYKAFYLKHPDDWVAQNYHVNDNRLKPAIPYEDLLIFALKDGDRICMAFAINITIQNTMQLEQMGFSISKDDTVCEALTFFINDDFTGEVVKTVSSLMQYSEEILVPKGFTTMYATCAADIKSMYTIFGFDVIDSLEYNGIEKLLLRAEAGT